jgi:glucosyl-3-phosphoglycerate synthase
VTAPPFDRAAPGLDLLERELALAAWTASNAFRADRWDLDGLLARKRESVSIVLPAREVADTIGSVIGALVPLERAGLVDEVVVVDAASTDGTARAAAEAGATVLQESEVLAELGPARGKGDAMWRGLAATSGDVVAYIDTDTCDFDERFLLGLLGPLFERPELEFVKGAFRRPFKVDGAAAVPDGGGRVTELVARPLLNLHAPELAGFVQPLAGETAARRALLESIPYAVGYGVEIAMILDVAALVGVEAMAQVDLGTRQNRHQALRELGAMAYAVLATATRRFYGDEAVDGARGAGALAIPGGSSMEMREVTLEERPPLRTLPAKARAAGATPASDRFSASSSR